jgi:DNA replication protein DnaC
VRVIEYTLDRDPDTGRPISGSTRETYRLVTTIRDPADAPAALYSQRWEHETLLDEITQDNRLVLRSRLPLRVQQEVWGILAQVSRRDRQSTLLRAQAAHLEPGMQLEAWDESTKVTFDRQLWAELTSMRFLTDSYNVLIMGPVGVGKTFLANALGHAAVRRKWTVHSERADKLFKRLRAARLDHTYTTRRCANCTGSSCSSLTTWLCSRWTRFRPVTSISWWWNVTGRRRRSSRPTGSRRKSWP